MTIYVQYDPSTADNTGLIRQLSIIAIAGSQATKPAPLAPQVQLEFPDNTTYIGMSLDISQDPPVLISAPALIQSPDMLTHIFSALIEQGWINPDKVDPLLLATVNPSLQKVGIPIISATETISPVAALKP